MYITGNLVHNAEKAHFLTETAFPCHLMHWQNWPQAFYATQMEKYCVY